jgi:hypothetical protein
MFKKPERAVVALLSHRSSQDPSGDSVASRKPRYRHLRTSFCGERFDGGGVVEMRQRCSLIHEVIE